MTWAALDFFLWIFVAGRDGRRNRETEDGQIGKCLVANYDFVIAFKVSKNSIYLE